MKEAVGITAVAAGGDGVGRMRDGRVVFVPRTAPGDQVELEGVTVKARYAHALPGHLRAAGPDRVEAACPHYERDRCGGCQLQHVAYDAQLRIKRAIVGDALRRIAKLDLPDPEVVEAVEEWRYRAKLTLAVPPHSRRAPAGSTPIGLHPFDRPNTVFSLNDCHITDLRLMDLWRALRNGFQHLPRPLLHLILRLDRDGREHVVVESGGPAWEADMATALRDTLSAGGHDAVLWWMPEEGIARVVAGPPTDFPATAFEQVNPDMGRLTRAWAVEQLGPLGKGAGAVWDLYGGVGDTAALLVARGAGARVVSVDADESAVAWAKRRSDAPGVRWIAAKVEDVIDELDPPDAAVVNPPRRGLHRTVVTRLLDLAKPCPVVYVSCDPATLARDLARLHPRYRVTRVRGFDLFPQTAHVETVAVLEPA